MIETLVPPPWHRLQIESPRLNGDRPDGRPPPDLRPRYLGGREFMAFMRRRKPAKRVKRPLGIIQRLVISSRRPSGLAKSCPKIDESSFSRKRTYPQIVRRSSEIMRRQMRMIKKTFFI
jgi:hypothetical protein